VTCCDIAIAAAQSDDVRIGPRKSAIILLPPYPLRDDTSSAPSSHHAGRGSSGPHGVTLRRFFYIYYRMLHRTLQRTHRARRFMVALEKEFAVSGRLLCAQNDAAL